VRLLLNHDGLPLARTTSGTLKLREDKRGLHFEADLDPNDPDVQRIAPKVQRGDLTR
jgi:HK97 family phage prohead protease